MAELWGVREAARHLEASVKTVKKLAKAGEIPMVDEPVETTRSVEVRVSDGTDVFGDPLFRVEARERPYVLMFEPGAVKRYGERRDAEREAERQRRADEARARRDAVVARHQKLFDERRKAEEVNDA